MKKTILITMALMLILFIMPLAVNAGEGPVIVPKDDFYNEHSANCYYSGRQFYAAAPDGKLGIYEDPRKAEPKAYVDNGTLFTILVTFNDYDIDPDLDWGCFDTGKNSGWVKMSEMELKYDSQQFREDYAEKISAYSEYVEFKADKLVLYTYPCSGEVKENYMLPYGTYTISRNPSYVDSQNRMWIYVGYLNSQGDGWFCYNDFENANIEKTDEPMPKKMTEEVKGEAVREEEDEKNEFPVWAILAIAAGCAAIAAAVVVLIKKRR